ncbi:MAG: M36 family metallopeptidase, partial [Pyrinomonadaceae bacterium]
MLLVAVIGVASVFFLSPQKHSEAAKGLSHQTKNQDDGVPNYDIRADKRATEKITTFRNKAGKNAFEIADRRDAMVRAEKSLKARIPNLKVEYNAEQQTPEIIATDVRQGKSFLTDPSGGKRSTILKTFLGQNSELVGGGRSNIDKLKVSAEYTNPDGELSFVELDQEIHGVPVFRGQVKAGLTKAGELIRVVNNLAADVDEYSTSTDFGDPLVAVNIAAGAINNDGSKIDRVKNSKASTQSKVVFGDGDLATTAEKMYFPTEPGVVVPAWRTLIWQPTNAFYVIVDAKSGTVLWRKNITDDQSQPATYNVYANPNAMVNIAHNPFPFSPGPIGPNGTQGAAVSRTSITRIGNEAPYTFNNQGWLPDGAIKTDGNNVQAGLDRDGTDGIDLNSEAVSATRDFTFIYSPLNPNDSTGENPVPLVQTYPGSQFQQGIVTQLFYITNWYHDETYRLGFTEAAGNFQNTN